MLELAASPIWAAVTGGIFPLITSVVGIFKARDEHKFRIEEARLDLDKLKLQGEMDQAKLAGVLAAERERGAGNAFTASVDAEGKIKGEHKWVTSFRALTRPCLTWFYQIYMVVVAALLLLGYALDKVENPLLQYLIISAVNTATMTVSWWFGQRQIDKMSVEWGNKSANAKLSK